MKVPIGYRLLYKYARFCFRLYYKVRISGSENIPSDKPVIFAANHQNALMDALAILFAADRPVNFLARADIFKKPAIARLLEFLKLMPVYRPRDGVNIVDKNSEVFNKVAEMLSSGQSFGIMPEGTHTHIKHLQPLKKGICHMTFEAAAVTDFTLDPVIVPVGLDYSNYHRPGSRLLVIFGEPIRASEYYQLYRDVPNKAVAQLRDRLAVSVRSLMIDVRHPQEYSFIIRYAESMAFASHQEDKKDPFVTFFKIKENVELLNNLIINDPSAYALLKEQNAYLLNDHSAQLSQNRPNYQNKSLPRLIFGKLFSSPGLILNCVPFLLSNFFSGKVKDPQFVSSIKYGTGILLFPIWYLIVFLISLIFSTPLVGIGLVLLMVITAVYTLKHLK